MVWHPSYREGEQIADLLRTHPGRDLYRGVGEERAVSVLERSQPVPDTPTPLPIDWDDTELTAVVVLAETFLIEDRDGVEYVRAIAETARGRGLPAGFFPVTMDNRGLGLGVVQQALRWDRWGASDADPARRLISDLTHEFCRMLRHRLGQLRPAGGENDALGRYLDRIRVFISHSKHDGESVGDSIRDWVRVHSPLDRFFDVYDIPPGLSFGDVLLHEIGAGALLAVHTASYSSREWCRREIIEAKRRLVPMIVVDCVRDADPRSMPYLGNVPVVRMDPDSTDRIGAVAGCLLDEVFRSWLWLCRIGPYIANSPGVLFTPRPPELIALSAVPSCGEDSVQAIVYPEPLMAADDERLFREIAPGVRVQTLTDWLEERR
ncbi:MAG: toll/interleukin-1 receptor domain-containing protein [Rhodospirillaceae bacterium]|nr:toll/interleukin-1 receptor domain-containing protein [Rhodospirillaceae bacterium]